MTSSKVFTPVDGNGVNNFSRWHGFRGMQRSWIVKMNTGWFKELGRMLTVQMSSVRGSIAYFGNRRAPSGRLSRVSTTKGTKHTMD